MNTRLPLSDQFPLTDSLADIFDNDEPTGAELREVESFADECASDTDLSAAVPTLERCDCCQRMRDCIGGVCNACDSEVREAA